ncbi:hypothetical protein GQ600_3336 [Phytophthora cactorum]|nr:hypothetical protein GQ600_3336 [Phytophthora cactorum]
MAGSPASYISHLRRFAFISLSSMVHRAPQEKVFIVHTHKYFLADAQTLLDPLGRAVRECVAKCLAVSANMVARVVAAYNVHGEEAFAVLQRSADAHQGRRSKITASLLRKSYMTVIYRVKPTTPKIICSELKILKDRTMREELARMDVFNIKGRKRDPRQGKRGI